MPRTIIRQRAWQWRPPPRPLFLFLEEAKKMCPKVVICYVGSLLWIKLVAIQMFSAEQGGRGTEGEAQRERWAQFVLDTL
jgi:hypothetical protein